MKSRPRRERPRGTAATRRRFAPLLAGVGALGAALIVIAALWSRTRPPARNVSAGSSAAQALAPVDAYREASRDLALKRVRESVPYFRRALSGLSSDFCEIHYFYGVALAVLSMQYAPRAGEPVPATRSSVERVGLVRESLAQLDRAAQLAADAAARTRVLRYRSRVLAAWGFPWEALLSYRETSVADPSDRQAGQDLARYLAAMRNPDRVSLGPDSLEFSDRARATADGKAPR